MKINATLRKDSPLVDSADHLFRSKSFAKTQRESPVFDPSDYGQGYPHIRTQVYKNGDEFWYLRSDKIFGFDQKLGRYSSTVFESSRSESGMFRSKSACFR